MGDMTLRDWVRVATQSKGNKRGLSLEKYCDSMLNPNTWGDEFIIRAFSFMESFSVYIYEHDACGFRKRSTGGDFTVAAEKGRLCLLYDGEHYDILVAPERPSFIPSLDEIRRINNRFEGMDAVVTEVPGKGLGLVAQSDLAQNVPVAYYLVKLYKSARVMPSTYLLNSEWPEHTGDLFPGSFQSPDADLVPYVAPLANEPSLGEEPNCVIRQEESANRMLRKFSLVTSRPVPKGEELCWDYGAEFGYRSYPSKYNK